MKMLRRLAFAAAAAFVCTSVIAQQRIDSTHTGSWFDPAASGHGFNFQLLPNRIGILFWYSFDASGRPIFFYGQTEQPIGVDAIEARFTTLFVDGMRFGEFNPNAIRRHSWGSMTIRFPSCASATLSYAGAGSPQFPNAPTGSGTLTLSKLADARGFECGAAAVPAIWEGFVQSGTTSRFATAIALPDGTFAYFNDANEGGVGRWSLEGQTLRATVNVCTAGLPATCASNALTGTLRPQVAINGTFTSLGGTQGRISMQPDRASDRPMRLADLAGQYREAPNFTATVLANGQFNALDSLTRCSYQGTFTQPIPGRNLFSVAATVSGCAVSGPLVGAASIIDFDAFGDGRLLQVILDGGTHGPGIVQATRD